MLLNAITFLCHHSRSTPSQTRTAFSGFKTHSSYECATSQSREVFFGQVVLAYYRHLSSCCENSRLTQIPRSLSAWSLSTWSSPWSIIWSSRSMWSCLPLICTVCWQEVSCGYILGGGGAVRLVVLEWWDQLPRNRFLLSPLDAPDLPDLPLTWDDAMPTEVAIRWAMRLPNGSIRITEVYTRDAGSKEYVYSPNSKPAKMTRGI